MKLAAALVTSLLVACSSGAKPVSEPMSNPEQPTSDPSAPSASATPADTDPYLWLEEVESEKALAWAKEQNKKSEAELSSPAMFTRTRDRIRSILDSKDKIPYASKRGALYYNFWKDAQNPRGLIRRTTLAEYKKPQPKWETVLDIDALAKAENENWVYAGNDWLEPSYDRVLVSLSRGGGDANVVREFDPAKKEFVKDGFVVPEAKSNVTWKDKDTLYVGTDFGPGSMTTSGYPRIVKEWKRGTKLADATTIYEGQASDLSISAGRGHDHGKTYDMLTRAISFYASEQFLLKDGKAIKIEIPTDAGATFWNGQIYVMLRTEWKTGAAGAEKTWPSGAMIAMPEADFLAGKREFTVLFEPSPTKSLAGVTELKSALVINELDDIKNKLYVWKVDKAGKWTKSAFPDDTKIGTVSVSAMASGSVDDEFWLTKSDYTTPSTLAIGALGKPAQTVKKSPVFFDAKGLVTQQHFATSKDGTRVPYFLVAKDKLTLDGSHPTLLYGYGGFEVSLTPGYEAVSGAAWEERGGVYAIANIRGGGEYGPRWHQAALRENRQRAYDDFIAIAEDLITKKITSPKKLGIMGGSNGGLLMGVMLTQRPDLFGAIVCQVPLLDMKRYSKLLAGASWMEEYGDPDKPEQWAYLSKFSPYQNVKKGVTYPRTLFTTSTRDDRVHPGHARKMVARMMEQGHDILYWENIEGGHGGAANNEQYAQMMALSYTFLAKQLGLE